MDKLIKAKRIWLILAISSAAVCVLGTLLALLFASKIMYVPMGIFLALAIFAFWGVPLCFFAYNNRKWAHRLLSVTESGVSDPLALAETLGVAPRFVDKVVKFSIKKGYIDGK